MWFKEKLIGVVWACLKWAGYFTVTGIHECFLMDFTKLFFSSQFVISARRRENILEWMDQHSFFLLLELSWRMLHLLWLYHIPQDSISDWKIQFLDILYPGEANCSLWQQRNTLSTHTVAFIQWSQGYLLSSAPDPGHSEINWLMHRDRISAVVFSNAHGFSLFPGCLNPVGLCPCLYICPWVEEANHPAYSGGLALAVCKEYFVLIFLSQPLMTLKDFCLSSSCV